MIERGRSERALVFVATLDDLATVAEQQHRAASPPRIDRDRVVGPGTNTSVSSAIRVGPANGRTSTA